MKNNETIERNHKLINQAYKVIDKAKDVVIRYTEKYLNGEISLNVLEVKLQEYDKTVKTQQSLIQILKKELTK